MRAIIHRIFIVLWIAAIIGSIGVFINDGIMDDRAWVFFGIFIIPLWALQFIITGIINPLKLSAKGA